MRRALLAVCLALTVVGVSGSSGAAPLHDLSWQIATKPFALDIRRDGARLTSLGGEAGVVVTGPDGREQPLSRAVSVRSSPTAASVELAGAGTRARARLDLRLVGERLDLSVKVTPARSATALRVTLAAPASAHFLGTGERDRFVDLKRTVQPLKVWNACGSSQSAPFFASTAGFGAFLPDDPVGRIAFPDALDDSNFACDLSSPSCSVGPPVPAVRICVKSATARLEIFPGDVAQTAAAYVRRAGLPRPPWLPQFALMKWRDSISGPEELYDDIAQLRALTLPVGWVILDNPWELGTENSQCFGSLTFDPRRYPDPRGMIARIHSLGVRFMLWVSPQIYRKGCPQPNDPPSWLTGDDEFYVRDLTNPAARADFVQRLKRLAALGIDGFKADRGDETDLEKVRVAGGAGAAFHNLYPRLYAEAVAAAMKPYRKQWAGLFRSAAPGSPRYAPGFVAEDTQHSWNGLYGAIRMGQTASVAGEAMWGSDIGGYAIGDVTPELFVRWAQFAATTPIFEVGGQGTTATFWTLGSGAVDGFRDAAALHYTLVPYLFELVRQSSATGAPVLRPLGLTWQRDARAWAQDAEYTVGDALLAAPVYTQQEEDGGSSVYLPAGSWVDWFTGARFHGGRTVQRGPQTPGFPLYVRAGTALAANFRDPEVWASPWRPDDLSRPGRQGWVLAPAAGASASARSGATVLTATASRRGDIEVRLQHAAPAQQLRISTFTRVCSVAGIPQRSDVTALRAAPTGWVRDPTRTATVVVKAHVRPTATLRLRAC